MKLSTALGLSLITASLVALTACGGGGGDGREVDVAAKAVTLPTADQPGFVGKGDVQTAFGWNNARMQANHTDVTFEYDNTVTISWVCTWTTGPTHNRQTHSTNYTFTTGVAATIASESRRTGQWTGWILSPVDLSGSGQQPNPDCNGNPFGGGNSGGKVVDQESITVTPAGGGLYAIHNGDRRLLPITP
jgi:hypothetical protein